MLEFNERHAFQDGVLFVGCGWELVSGTVMRPQDAINPMLHLSDFVVLILWDRWGSPTGGVGWRSSGTEEEFYEAAKALADESLPMRDMLVLFKAVPDRQMSDPGSQLSKVLEFRNWLEIGNQVLFQTFDSDVELKQCVHQAMMGWVRQPAAKSARVIALPNKRPWAADEAMARLGLLAPEELLARAEELAADGLKTQAEAAFAIAMESRDIDITLRYARFMRRTGRLERAYQLDDEVVRSTIASTTSESIAQRASALANMGVVRRKQGRLRESSELLREAVQSTRVIEPSGRAQLAYALDNLGLTLTRQAELDEARSVFGDALRLRRLLGDASGEAQSLINCARVARSLGDPGASAADLEAAVRILEDSEDEPALANALSSLGQLHLSEGADEQGERLIRRALEINTRLRNSDGMSITNALLARHAMKQGRFEDAMQFAGRCREESAGSANREGLAIALQLLGQISLGRGQLSIALEYLAEAVPMFVEMRDSWREAAARLDLATVLHAEGSDSVAGEELKRARVAAGRSHNVAAGTSIDLLEAELHAVEISMSEPG